MYVLRIHFDYVKIKLGILNMHKKRKYSINVFELNAYEL